jgi:hypothetical protein
MQAERRLEHEGERDPLLAAEAATTSWESGFYDSDVEDFDHDLIEDDEESAEDVAVVERNVAARRELRKAGARMGYSSPIRGADAICDDPGPRGGGGIAVVGPSGEVESRLSPAGAQALAAYRCNCGVAGMAGDTCLRFLRSGTAKRRRNEFFSDEVTKKERGRLIRREMQNGMELDGKGGWKYMFNVQGYRICSKTWREVFKVQTSLWYRVKNQLEEMAEIPEVVAPVVSDPLRVRTVTGATEKVGRGESVAGKAAVAWLGQYALTGEQMPQTEKTDKRPKKPRGRPRKPSTEGAPEQEENSACWGDASASEDDEDDAYAHPRGVAAGKLHAAAVERGEARGLIEDTAEADIGDTCEIRLAETLRKDVHETYVHAMMLRKEKFVHRTSFLAMWKRDFPHLKCARPKGTHAMCGVSRWTQLVHVWFSILLFTLF